MLLPVINNGESLTDFDDGRWLERLLPIYDTSYNFLSPVHYESLTGALVEVSATAMYHTVKERDAQGVYLQVRDMEVLKPGRGRRLA